VSKSCIVMAGRDVFSRTAMLNLYRTVLKLHRRALPQEMREIGDRYARSEFKAHKSANVGQVKVFAKEWKEYVYTIELQSSQGTGAFGQNLDEAKIKALNEEQRENVKRLEREAKRGVLGDHFHK
jgi:hypothetical protein